MKKRLTKFLGLLVALLSPTLLYAQKGFFLPEPLIIPVHTQKNQLHLSAGVGGGYGLATSYSVSNHLALFLSGSRNNWTSRRTALLGGKIRIENDNYAVAGGLGYLVNPASTGFLVEIYAGAALHQTDNYWYFLGSEVQDVTRAEYWSGSGQVNMIKRKGKSELGGAARLSYNRYTDFRFVSAHDAPETTRLFKDLWSVNLEPVGSYSYSVGRAKLNVQAGVSFPVFREWSKMYVQDTNTQEQWEVAGLLEKPSVAAFIGRFSLQYNLALTSGDR